MQDPSLQHVKGVVNLHYLKLRFSRYFNQQRKTSMPQPMEASDHLTSRIQGGDIAWAPPLSFALQTSLGVPLLLCLTNLASMQKPLGGGAAQTTGSTTLGTMVPGVI